MPFIYLSFFYHHITSIYIEPDINSTNIYFQINKYFFFKKLYKRIL